MNPYFRDSFLEDPWKNLRSDRNLKSSEELHLSQESMMAGKDFSSKRTLIGEEVNSPSPKELPYPVFATKSKKFRMENPLRNPYFKESFLEDPWRTLEQQS
mmetsp:Transcript_12847/g.14749  ORF Transcript_12847/g.14749 Transcript_12847/m.14749 type:complete len:101 (+) Transcript_12847:338-640(+)|eukprot:CAMPEP_0184009106 /NCGR_PEP_ID=MMETSP0954-20121128/2397_1 /TAXON_ID=627963 /ORGANISM="Aplanochytrium sp, Strain PBS07" /LENGTH=100 /DNA_ID=CAMNT_0026288395 /DNA_START=2117 /DNA_END=2419 /DNA_ORIENTATION=-